MNELQVEQGAGVSIKASTDSNAVHGLRYFFASAVCSRDTRKGRRLSSGKKKWERHLDNSKVRDPLFTGRSAISVVAKL